MAARLELIVLNTDASATCRRSGCSGTIITLASLGIAVRISGWHVLKGFTANDHQEPENQFIGFEITRTTMRIACRMKIGWKTRSRGPAGCDITRRRPPSKKMNQQQLLGRRLKSWSSTPWRSSRKDATRLCTSNRVERGGTPCTGVRRPSQS